MATHLCLASLTSVVKLGQPVGQKGVVVDIFEDNVACSKLPFNSWRNKHDDCKVALVERVHYAHIDCDAEVFSLCYDLVHAAVINRGVVHWRQ